MTKPRLTCLVALVAAMTMLLATPAAADEVDDILGEEKKDAPAEKKDDATDDAKKAPADIEDDVVAVEPSRFLKAKRFEIGIIFGASTNDPFLNHSGLGLTLDFHLTEALSVGLRGMYYFASKSNIIRETVRLQAVPLINAYVAAAALTMHYSPFYGKFALFGRSVMHWEVYLGGGIGLQFNQVLLAPTFTVRGDMSNVPQSLAINLAAGARLYLTDFLTIFVDFRDFLAFINPEDRDGEQPAFLAQNLVLGAGISIFVPVSFKRAEEL